MMKKHLFFICPTDYLETVIDASFEHENYYVSSLGNSMVFDRNNIEEINCLIKTNAITEISFVLSNNNSIVMDALGKQNFAEISRLANLYHQITQQQERARRTWPTKYLRSSIFSYYLTAKVRALLPKLNEALIDELKINAKIYDRKKNVFYEVFSNLIYQQDLILN